MSSPLETFIASLHPSSKLIVRGTASVMDNMVEAALVRNLYGQMIVWGMFSIDKGKFKGKLANDANTDGVVFHYPRSIPFEYVVKSDWPSPELRERWFDLSRDSAVVKK